MIRVFHIKFHEYPYSTLQMSGAFAEGRDVRWATSHWISFEWTWMGCIFYCGHPQSMATWPLDSPSIVMKTAKTSVMEPCGTPVFLDVSTKIPRTRQLTNDFKNYTPDIDWYDCHFTLKFKFTHNDSTRLNLVGINTLHCPWCSWRNLHSRRKKTKWRWTMK